MAGATNPPAGAKRWIAINLRPIAWPAFGFIGVVIELGLGLAGAFDVLGGRQEPIEIDFAFVGVAAVWLAAYLLSFQWFPPWSSDEGKIKPDNGTRPKGRMLFAVFFGYMLVLASAVVGVSALLHAQVTMSSGLATNSHENRQLLLTVQAPTEVAVGPFQTNAVPVPVNVTLGFMGAPVGAFVGGAVFTVERLDSPLALDVRQAASVRLDSLAPRVQVNLTFNPRGGFESKSYDILYSLQYNVSVPSLGNFTGFLKDSMTVMVEGKA